MSNYQPPLRDMQFVIENLCDFEQLARLPAFAEHELTTDLVDSVLEEAGKLASRVLAPLNRTGDLEGAQWQQQKVQAASGFAKAYQQFIDDGWNGLSCNPQHGGQGLPDLINTVAQEIWNGANSSFALCPMLTAGSILCLENHASDELKAQYLPKMIAGQWTGTMNLTEPQAGSDLSQVQAKAIPDGDHYRIYGQKIYITWGEHDMTDNIIHMVLARLPDAPAGVKGISLFLVPKFLLDDKGKPSQRNDVKCLSIEHKLGIHASPTCTMAFGDEGQGAIGYLIGQPHQGLKYMFTMMNEARLKVGVQAVGLAEAAYQHALAYAQDRVQGYPMKGTREGQRVTIDHHPDVRRMLAVGKAQTQAMRALNYVVAATMDQAHHQQDAKIQAKAQARVDLLIPVVKGWCTEAGAQWTWQAVQIFGGMGFVEETGAAQFLRDARITTIYEGTTGIQAADLVARKLPHNNGQAMEDLLADIAQCAQRCQQHDQKLIKTIGDALASGHQQLQQATVSLKQQSPSAVLAVSVPYLMLLGVVAGGWQMARSALVIADQSDNFAQQKRHMALVYAQHVLCQSDSLSHQVQQGGPCIADLPLSVL